MARDVSCVEDWDAEIEEEARRGKETKETAAQQSEEEDWDAPEAQTDPGNGLTWDCLLYTSPSPRDKRQSRMPSSA